MGRAPGAGKAAAAGRLAPHLTLRRKLRPAIQEQPRDLLIAISGGGRLAAKVPRRDGEEGSPLERIVLRTVRLRGVRVEEQRIRPGCSAFSLARGRTCYCDAQESANVKSERTAPSMRQEHHR